jgi:TRAP-type C4-dicarboxylate transport system permease large subunit
MCSPETASAAVTVTRLKPRVSGAAAATAAAAAAAAVADLVTRGAPQWVSRGVRSSSSLCGMVAWRGILVV